MQGASQGADTVAKSCRYALTGKEVVSILMQRLVRVDGKVRTDATYPAGFMDVIDIEKTDEHFRLIYDSKGRFVTHRITKVPTVPTDFLPSLFLAPKFLLTGYSSDHLGLALPCYCSCACLGSHV